MADINLKPTAAMASNAERGLALREEHGRGGTAVGVARARDIKNRKNLSPSTVRRMHSFFSRHEVDKKGKGWESGSEGYPSNGLIAWLLWGGDSGKSWAESKTRQLDKSESQRMRPSSFSREKDLTRLITAGSGFASFQHKGTAMNNLLAKSGKARVRKIAFGDKYDDLARTSAEINAALPSIVKRLKWLGMDVAKVIKHSGEHDASVLLKKIGDNQLSINLGSAGPVSRGYWAILRINTKGGRYLVFFPAQGKLGDMGGMYDALQREWKKWNSNKGRSARSGAKSTHAADDAVSKKIATLIREGCRRDQAVAIAYDMKRRGEL